jgi:Mu transposase, C-terminal domain
MLTGMVSVGGNLYSVPDATRKRIVEVHTLADEIRIFEDGALIALHPVLEGRHQRRVAPGHRKMPRLSDQRRRDEPALIGRAGDLVVIRPLDFYHTVGRRLAAVGDQP